MDRLEELVEGIYRDFGRIDVLVNNAGISPVYEKLSDVSEEMFDKVIAVNLKGPFRLAALVGERMVTGNGGSIINVSSTGAVRPTSDIVPYAAAKAGVNAMTVGLAHAFGPRVRVNAIMPGPFLTTISRSWDMDVFAERARPFRLRRAGAAEEIVGAALYLASDASAIRRGPSSRSTVALSGAWRAPLNDDQLEFISTTGCGDGSMSMNGPPLWLKVVYRLERAVGEPIESAVRGDAYFDAVTVMRRVRRKATNVVDGLSQRGLHLLNLPAGTDVRRMREQLSRIERGLNQLSEGLEELEDTHPRVPVD